MTTILNSRSIMDANILIRSNFLDWIKNLSIVLKKERLYYVLVEPLPQFPVVDAFETI